MSGTQLEFNSLEEDETMPKDCIGNLLADAETQDAQAAIDKARNSAQETILKAERHLAQLRGPARVSDHVRALETKIEALRRSALV